MSLNSGATGTSTVTPNSNLVDFRALLQVMSYASERKQAAEDVVRNALTGGVTTAFVVESDTDSNRPVLLLPSSKCLSVVSSLVADGFFTISPFSRSVEGGSGTASASYQYLTECDIRDLFTLIIVLYSECYASDALVTHFTSTRDDESSTRVSNRSVAVHEEEVQNGSRTLSLSSSPRGGDASLEPPVPERLKSFAKELEVNHILDISAESGKASMPQEKGGSPSPQNSVGSSRSTTPSVCAAQLCKLMSASRPANLKTTGLGLSVSTMSSTFPNAPVVVPRPLDAVLVLLDSRAAVAMVFLSVVNDMLHGVQYRELQRRQSRCTPLASKSEGSVLVQMTEVLLRVKMMLLYSIAAAEVWRRRAVVNHPAQVKTGTGEGMDNPFRTAHQVLKDQLCGAAFTLAVESWTWGVTPASDSSGSWYDAQLNQLLHLLEGTGIKLDALLRSAKHNALEEGRAITHIPCVLLHRPADGHPAIRMAAPMLYSSFLALRLPQLPLQPGELQVLLLPESHDANGAVLPCELLFDSAESHTVSFLKNCLNTPFNEVQLRASGTQIPHPLSLPWASLSDTQQNIIATFFSNPENTSSVMEKNAPMLARVVLWCRGSWPPREASTTHHIVASDDDRDSSVAACIEKTVFFELHFSAATGRFLRELIALRGLHEDVFRRWVVHCSSQLESPNFLKHRSMFSALTKFAVLHNGWTLEEEEVRRIG